MWSEPLAYSNVAGDEDSGGDSEGNHPRRKHEEHRDEDELCRNRRTASDLEIEPEGNRVGDELRVTVTVNSLLGLVSVLDGGTVSNNGTWKPSPQVSLLLTNVGGLLTTKAISLRFTATSGTSQIDDVYLDPFKDT